MPARQTAVLSRPGKARSSVCALFGSQLMAGQTGGKATSEAVRSVAIRKPTGLVVGYIEKPLLSG